jgi:hypothetical protein
MFQGGQSELISYFADVLKDTVTALKKGPQRNVQVGDFMSFSNEEKLKHGNDSTS